MTDNKPRELYQELEPIQIHYLDRPGGHRIYVEECGNRQGIPVVFLHGGPGSGCSPSHRRYFNPEKYYIILFDQRGAGRSEPYGHLEMNTTQDLVTDMEAIRIHFGIGSWLLFGGSWGSALALLYAQTFPQWVSGMILRGSFLARERDLHWFTAQGAVNILPDDWQKFCDSFEPCEQSDPVGACYRAIFSADSKRRLAAAKAWTTWSDRVVTYNLRISDKCSEDIANKQKTEANSKTKNAEEETPTQEQLDFLIRKVALEMHYAYHRYFIQDNQLLNHIGLLPHVPVMLIHGRKDLTCPVESSWLLHRAIAQSSLKIIADAGHLAGEAMMIDALVDATDEMLNRL